MNPFNETHISGPYAARRLGPPSRVIEIFAPCGPIARVYESQPPFATKGERARVDATAKLLASAPDLFDALRDLLNLHERSLETGYVVTDSFKVARARALLAETEGVK